MKIIKNLENHKGSRVYGRRHGKALKPKSMERFQEYFPKYSITLPVNKTLDPKTLFTHHPEEIWLEIGFGKGEHLAWQASTHLEVGMIGCEPFMNGVSGLVDHIVSENLSNIRFFMDDARLLIDALPDASIARAFILFPDPWPKTKHHKRRVINEGNLKQLSRVLKNHAELRIATDHHDYRRWIIATLSENKDFKWKSDHPDDWHKRGHDWPSTRYEIKALKEGRKSAYLTYIRRAGLE
jgi:tRNA (guanine-N7-)-methyltransferase